MRISLMLLLFSSAAVVLSGCPLSGGDSDEDVADSVASDAEAGRSDVEADGSLPDTNELDDSSQASDSAIPDIEGSPCIAVAPGALHFGGKVPGTTTSQPLEIQSCGDSPLEVRQVVLSVDSLPAFGIDLEALPTVPSDESPLVLAPGESVTVHVTYVEQCLEPPDDVDGPSPTPGAVVIHSNAPKAETIVPLEIAGVASIMPLAVIECQEGNQVVPGTVLHLIGDDSYIQCNEEGTITKWEWAVEQPEGSTAKFIPSHDFPNPSFEVDLSGIYTFYLVVYDENNTPSCFPAEYEVAVIPDETIHIELFWHTPGDPDETDAGPEAGADLDLHLLHPLAEGPDIDNDGEPNGWFDVPWDCFWYNPSPDWSPQGPEGNPVCPEKNDDYGPESITFAPGEELTYRVGVHDWDDHGYGPSYATVRVYLYGTLAFEFADVKLQKLLTWEVCEIEWPSGKIEPILDENGEPNILLPINCGFTGCPPWE